METVGQKIRMQRLLKQYSQEYMAFMLEISQAAYSNIERDATEPGLRRLYEIAEILEISPFVLMPKPKYGTGINIHSLLHTWHKLKKLWTGHLAGRRARAAELNISQRDISNSDS
jgi:transcriptional regulator with XRE-family HTH domain